VGGYLERRELLQRQGKEKARLKATKEKLKQRHQEKTKASKGKKAHQGKGCLTSQG
jgi:hypothetical protein